MRTRVWLASSRTVAVVVAVVAAAYAGGPSGITGASLITRVAGVPRTGGGFSGDGGPAIKALLGIPRGIAVDRHDNIYIADSANHRVRKITACGVITTIAGTGVGGFSGDGGPAVRAQLNLPFGVALDSKDNLYIADKENSRVRKVTPDGTISTFAGSGFHGILNEGGPATASNFIGPWDVKVDRADNVYITAPYDGYVLKVTSDGILHRFAGGGRSRDLNARREGIPATSAFIQQPQRLALDRQGNVYLSQLATTDGNREYTNGLVRRIDPSGTITTVAGMRELFDVRRIPPHPRTGSATKTPLVWPMGVAVDTQGSLYLTEDNGNRIRKVAGGVMTIIAGSDRDWNSRGYSAGDGGPARGALLHGPEGLAFDTRGNLLVADTVTGLIRKIWTATPRSRPRLAVTAPAPQRPLARNHVTLTVSCDKPCRLHATGTITVAGRTLALTPARARHDGSSCPVTLALRLPADTRAELRDLLAGGAAGRATVRIGATDAGRHTTTATRTIPVRA